jgi:hypothetical protein
MVASIARVQVLGFRVRAEQLDRPDGQLTDTAVLDIGVQDSGPDGGLWALRNRGVDDSKLSGRELPGRHAVGGDQADGQGGGVHAGERA